VGPASHCRKEKLDQITLHEIYHFD